MTYYDVTFRVTTTSKLARIEAETPEAAIQHVLEQTPPDSAPEVMQVVVSENEPVIEPPGARAVESSAAEHKSGRHHR